MNSRAARRILLILAAFMMMLSTWTFAAGNASASTYPQADIHRTMFINPYDYTTGPAWLPYSAPRTIYLTAGTYSWNVQVYTTWSLGIVLGAFRSIYLRSNWYYWRCYLKTVLVDPVDGTTGVSNYCSLTPTDGSTPTAYLSDTIDEGSLSAWDAGGAGDYMWISTLQWESNP